MFKNLMIILSLLVLVLVNLLPSEPKAQERELRKIAEHAVDPYADRLIA